MKHANYYTLLGISQKASLDDIKKAYRQKAKQLHPDKGVNDSNAIKELNRAYETLKNPTSRAAYDKQIGVGGWYEFGQNAHNFKKNLKENLTILKETLTAKKPEQFDEHLTIFVAIWQAALGDKVAVQTTHHHILVPIPSFDNQLSLKISGAGLVRPNGGFGDLYLTVKIKNPPLTNLNPEQKRAFLALKQAFTAQ